ncbi:MAG TPA: epimerase, partial [Archangium sp.]
MRVLLVGGSGMIGQGVLLECLKRAEVTKVISVGRSALPQTDPKLENLIKKDLYDWSDVADR